MTLALVSLLGLIGCAFTATLAWVYLLYRKDVAARNHANGPWSEYGPMVAAGESRRVALFYWGSRGDLQPMVVLARHLKADGHTVRVSVRTINYDAARSLGLEDEDLVVRKDDDRPEEVLVSLVQGKTGVAMLFFLFRHIASHLPSYVRDIEQLVASHEVDVIIVNEFAFVAGQIVAERSRLPLFVLRCTPLFVSTTSYLCPMLGSRRLGCLLHWASFLPGSLIRLLAERKVLRQLRPGASPLRYYFGRWHWQFPSIQAYSRQLMPTADDTPRWYDQTGPLLPLAQEETEPVPPLLAEFLSVDQRIQPVIYIGFGSFSLAQFLPKSAARRAAYAMLAAIEDLGVRAVLLQHTFAFMTPDPRLEDRHLYIARSFPHSWLFPRVSVVVHQAGAGHCAASARSGTPTIAIPIFDEQEYNARTLIQAGGAVRLGITDLTRESFKLAFHEALKLSDRARMLSEAIEAEVQSSGTLALNVLRRELGLPCIEPASQSKGSVT